MPDTTTTALSASSVDLVTIQAAPVQTLAALLGHPPEVHADGAPLPPLWHWAATASWADASSTGADGHPRRPAILPGRDLPRRMFAGGQVEHLAPLHIGDQVRREVKRLSVESKRGRRGGDFVLVRVRTTLTPLATDEPAVREVQNLIYRGPTTALISAPVHRPAAAMSGSVLRREDSQWVFDTDPTTLMRFSAATANGHRIHYDHPYATEVEGYPDLVVHGPLMTLALAEMLRRERHIPRATLFRHRALAPLFCGQAAGVEIRFDGDAVHAALRADGEERSLLTVT